MDFGVPVDHQMKIKENEKKEKYLDLARELETLWNMRIMVILIIIGAFWTVIKGLVWGLEEWENGRQIKTIQTTA